MRRASNSVGGACDLRVRESRTSESQVVCPPHVLGRPHRMPFAPMLLARDSPRLRSGRLADMSRAAPARAACSETGARQRKAGWCQVAAPSQAGATRPCATPARRLMVSASDPACGDTRSLPGRVSSSNRRRAHGPSVGT